MEAPESVQVDRAALTKLAHHTRAMGGAAPALGTPVAHDFDPSVTTFGAVLAAVPAPQAPALRQEPRPKPRNVILNGERVARVQHNPKGVRLDIAEGGFADWVEEEANGLLQELYKRWQERAQRQPEQSPKEPRADKRNGPAKRIASRDLILFLAPSR